MDRSNEDKVFHSGMRSVIYPMGSRLLSNLSRPYRMLLLLLLIPFASAQQNSSAYQAALLEIQQHIESGDLSSASSLLARAAKQYPSDGGVENLRGVLEAQQGNAASC